MTNRNKELIDKELMSISLLRDLSTIEMSNLKLEQDSLDSKQKRVVKSDTKKNRKELFDAIDNKDYMELLRLINLGTPLNIIDERNRGSYKRTPLASASANKWPQGLLALLEAGADETLIPSYLYETPLPGRKNTYSCLEIAVINDSIECFKILFHRMNKIYQERAISAIRKPSTYIALEELGEVDRLSIESLMMLAKNTINALDPATNDTEKGETDLRAFESIFKRLGIEENVELSSNFWVMALQTRKIAIVQALAKMNCKLPEQGLLKLKPNTIFLPDKAPAIFVNRVKNPNKKPPYNITSTFNQLAEEPILMDFATASLALRSYYGNVDLTYALCAIKQLRELMLSNPFGIHMLAQCVNIPLYKRLSSLDVDLTKIKDDQGLNPLHHAAKLKESMTVMENLAKICPEWINQRDLENKTPFDFIDANRRTQMATTFDQIGIRDALGGKRGPKTKTKSRI